MKKKGFTLIELLAVIVVLAIIALIATPMVINTIEDAKKGAAKSSTLMMVDAARLYHAKQYMDPSNKFEGFECNISNGDGCDELSVKGQKPDSGIISISNKGVVSGMVKFGKYTYYICNDQVSEEEMAGCSFTDYSLVYNITNEGIITGFKNKEETAFFTIIEEVNASELTDEAKEVIENKSLTIPEYVGDIEVKGIGANAFTNYEIEKITILSSKRITIGENALPENLSKLRVSECISRHYSEYEDILETFKSTCKFKEYTITYDLNGGTGYIPAQYKEEDVDATLTTSTPTRTGYIFFGWATTSDAISAEYEAGAIYTNDSDLTLYAVWKKAKKCVRATELHQEKCELSKTYCKSSPIITYGNEMPELEKLNSGDAFTCDVNGDGKYNETTERFYYVTDLSSNAEYAVLIYYSNTVNDVIDNKTSSLVSFGSGGTGPSNAKTYLPKTTQWKNVSLFNTIVASGYSYEGYAARLITRQEIVTACKTSSPSSMGALSNCNYLLENTTFTSNSYVRGYWTETSYNASYTHGVSGTARSLDARPIEEVLYYGVRPVIEVLKTDITY